MLKNLTITLLLLLIPSLTYAMVGAVPIEGDGPMLMLTRVGSPDKYIKSEASERIYLVREDIRYWLYNEAMINVHITEYISIEEIDGVDMKGMEEGRDMYLPVGNLVKKVIGDRIYDVVGDGELEWLRSPSIVQSRYGNNWGELVQVVPDKYFEEYTVK